MSHFTDWHEVIKNLPRQERYKNPDFEIADLVHAMFRSGNEIPVERITITRAQYEAAMKGDKA